MSEEFDLLPESPNNIKLFYVCKGEFITIHLNLEKSKFSLTQEEMQRLNELPLSRGRSMISPKICKLRTLRDSLIDVMNVVMEILAIHTIRERTPK